MIRIFAEKIKHDADRCLKIRINSNGGDGTS